MSGFLGGLTSAIATSKDMIPCTWRMIPIQIYSYTITNAPQVKIHMGAYWKKPIVEDLGHAPTIIKISGFIQPTILGLNLGFIERPLLEAMVMAKGSGMLTIPSKGMIYAHCLSCTFREDISNIVDVDLEFVEVASPLGLLGDLLNGSLPDSIGESIANAQDTAMKALSGAVDSAKTAIGNLF